MKKAWQLADKIISWIKYVTDVLLKFLVLLISPLITEIIVCNFSPSGNINNIVNIYN